MKFVRGIALPDGDTHFSQHLEAGPEFNGAGTYQFAKIQMALDLAPDRRGLAVDVGGHVGLWSRVLTEHYACVHAFEPLPSLQACFQVNASKAILHGLALGNQIGQVDIAVIGENSGNGHVVPAGAPSATAFRAQMTTLDLWTQTRVDAHPVDLLKLDVEGYETAVIQGARVTILRDRPAIVVECKPGNAERYGFGETQAVNLLRSWGYEIAGKKSGDYFLRWKD